MELLLATSVVTIVIGVLAAVVRLVPYPEDLEQDGSSLGSRVGGDVRTRPAPRR